MSLTSDVRQLLGRAGQLYGTDASVTARLQHVQARLEAPLRVAIAGKVKAGKSTLLNALVGERLAPTDEGECTKVVTWYQDGHTYQVMAHPRSEAPSQLRFRREDNHLEIDLGGRDPLTLERLEVTWPSASLRAATLIDTPGIGSLSTRVAEQTTRFLAPEDDVTQADAVLYLMKHLHANDLAFLEAFHDTEVSQPNPVNAIAVLSRADEIGVGRLDSMGSANRIANRYKHDPNVRRLAQTVVPMAGLLAETATTLTEDEFRMIRTLAGAAAKEIDELLLSADRFVNSPSHTGLTDLERQHLLSRFGVFGIRLSTTLARRNAVKTASELSAELEERSGLNDLKSILSSLFVARSELLKARSALLALDDILRMQPVPGADQLSLEVERVMANAHPFTELRVLNAVRAGWVTGKPEQLAELERLIGAEGTEPSIRLGLPREAEPMAVLGAAQEALLRWQRRAENPLTRHEMSVASRVAIRSCEEILANGIATSAGP
ncbi:MAG: dynamin family protein [Acidimicrobiales bacterium]|nr:dynamin family protein [Acidimicrobiales bacterium]